MRGRPRSRKPACPAHIDARKLPDYCYWDGSGKGHWYTKIKDPDGKWRRRKVAGPRATLADLHKEMEALAGRPLDCLNWLADKFEKSAKFKSVSERMQDDWTYCQGVVCTYPSKQPGVLIGQIPLSAWKPALVQKLIDGITETRGPSSAKHCHSYIKRVFNWGIARGYCASNPCPRGVIELPKERQRRRLPAPALVAKLVAFARERSARPSRTKGSCPHYIWLALELAYLNRLRGIEVFALTDACELDDGLLCQRTKGSGASVTRWNPRLREVFSEAQKLRSEIFRKSGRPIPFRPEDRFLMVTTGGKRIAESSWQSAWARFMKLAVREGVITEEEKFGLHDMKRRGLTDTKGTKADKLEAGGHSSLQMLKVYDHSIPVVDAVAE
ncbi:site-specific integrase [Pseudohongiella spirulinae]|uniref:Integrase n=1 Tax=Pseudohongiella spirulinae TaxID=1249552 RepID=A0A0S2KE86_9GAMM|nr:hypothetical protein [Pseudohongiella spirulinae]ALO46616.1 integrase [Pseudohongiella spirulinae]